MEDLIIMRNKDLERIKVIQRLAAKQLTQIEAGKLLRVSDRQIRKLWRAYKLYGDNALISKKLGQPSNHQISQAIKNKAFKIIIENYSDFGPTLATEKLRENHDIKLSVETVRQLMSKQGLWQPARSKPAKMHLLRARRPCVGELLIIDGSIELWFEDRGPRCVLLVFIDDATSSVQQLWFTPTEDSEGYFSAMELYLKKYGRPLAIYTDRHAVFQVEKKSPLPLEQHFTQFERAMRELDIKLIHANSPQAKGRVERCNRTLQDRLIKELRLQDISDIDSANQFAEEYLLKHNSHFAVPPAQRADLHRPLESYHNLERILCPNHLRQVQKDLTFQYAKKVYQIQEASSAIIGKSVVLWSDKTGSLQAAYEGRLLKIEAIDEVICEPILARASSKHWIMRQHRYRPNKTHPYKTKFKI
jgi:hypothetical protein